MSKTYQGGYQIIDIGGDEIYSKAKSAFETNKPVLVYDGGIASYGNVTKSSTNFVLNYIINNKIYKATVATDGTVTKTNVDIGGSATDIEALETAVNGLTNEAGTGTVDKLEDRLDANKIGTSVDLTAYDGTTEGSDFYTAPKDGLLWVRCANVATNRVQANFKAPNDSVFDVAVCGSTVGPTDVAFPVKKGWKLWTASNTGTSNSVRYAPYDN